MQGVQLISERKSGAGLWRRSHILLTCGYALAAVLVLLPVSAHADAVDASGYAGVAPAGFSYVAAADAPIVSAVLSIFADADGLSDITNTLQVSDAIGFGPPTRAAGFVNIKVTGATSETTYYARLTLDFGGGPVNIPATTPLLPVVTSKPLMALESSGQIQFNALASFSGTAAESLTLITLAPAAFPLVSFATAGTHVFDLNNLKDSAGATPAIAAGEVVVVNEALGAACPTRRVISRVRRAPAAVPTGAAALQFTELTRCFFADTNCDDVVDVLDLQYFLGFFPDDSAACGFNSDLDADTSGTVNVLDMQSLLNRFDDVAPF